MNRTPSRIGYSKIETLVDGKDPMLGRVIETACREINSAEQAIADGLRDLEYRINSVRTSIDAVQRLNGLGEFQSTPRDLDAAITKRQRAFDTLALVLSEDDLKIVMGR